MNRATYFTAVELVASAQRMHEATEDWQREQDAQHQMALIASHIETHERLDLVVTTLASMAAAAINAYADATGQQPKQVLNLWAQQMPGD